MSMRTIYATVSIPRFLATRAMSRIWPDVIVSPIGVARYTEIPDPPLPTARHVRVRNRVALICGSDLHWVRGEGDPRVAVNALPSTGRFYLGHELCGEVIETGAAVETVRPGDRVALRYPLPSCGSLGIEPSCRHCAHGQYALCENQASGREPVAIGGGWGDTFVAHAYQLYRPPQSLSDEQIALLETTSVGLHAALCARPQPGDRVLILGCGATGLLTLQALHVLMPDVHITALARYPFQGEAARQLGAHEVALREDGYELTERLTGARLYRGSFGGAMLLGGYDVVYDCVGSSRTLTDALRWTRAAGQVALVGISFDPLRVDMTPLWYQQLRLVGPIWHGREVWQGEEIDTFDLAARLTAQGRLQGESLITHRYPFSNWREAVKAAIDKGRYGSIKVAIEMG
jgi:threonine dehydrogenase-like Zn-dependent dehydrogenase